MRKDTLATRTQIIRTAEALFAEGGVERTSLLDIAKASGQKNRSAIQYHFSNKEGLLDAVLDKHASTIAEARNQRLDQLELQDSYTLQELIEALVLPFATALDNPDGGHAFIKIHSELMTTASFSELRQRRDQAAVDVQRFQAMMAPLVDNTDPIGLRIRQKLLGSLLIHSLADYTSQPADIPQDRFLATLVQAITGLLQQP